jgi:hypothetical protein
MSKNFLGTASYVQRSCCSSCLPTAYSNAFWKGSRLTTNPSLNKLEASGEEQLKKKGAKPKKEKRKKG